MGTNDLDLEIEPLEQPSVYSDPQPFFHWRWGPTPSANDRRRLPSDLLILRSAWPQALASCPFCPSRPTRPRQPHRDPTGAARDWRIADKHAGCLAALDDPLQTP